MTFEELASCSGETVDELRRWRELDLLPDETDLVPTRDTQRVRLLRFAIGRGYSAERLAAIAAAHGDMVGHFAERVAELTGDPVATVAAAADDSGIEPNTVERLRSAAGLADQTYAYAGDIDVLRLMKTALDAGMPIDLLVQIVRVFATASERLADGASRLFHLYLHEELRSGGASGMELLSGTSAISDQVLDLIEPAVLYFHRKAWERAWAEDMMLHLAEEATAPSEVRGEFMRAFLFVDLSSFTPLTEAMGDAAAAQVIERFAELVREGAARCSGQVVKQIGDEFMVVFPDGRSAVTCGLSIEEKAAAEPRFPALRMGANFGSVLYREGDYVGATVNVAARVASAATRHQFLVTAAVRKELGDLDIDIVSMGRRSLKGVSEDAELFEVRRPGARHVKVVDPVCGMELDEESSDAELNWKGDRLLFCSERCLRRFLDNPDQYTK